MLMTSSTAVRGGGVGDGWVRGFGVGGVGGVGEGEKER